MPPASYKCAIGEKIQEYQSVFVCSLAALFEPPVPLQFRGKSRMHMPQVVDHVFLSFSPALGKAG